MNAIATELTARHAATSAQYREDHDSRAYLLNKDGIRASAENSIIQVAKAAFGDWVANSLLRIAHAAMDVDDPRRDMIGHLNRCTFTETHGVYADDAAADEAAWFLECATEFAEAIQAEAE